MAATFNASMMEAGLGSRGSGPEFAAGAGAVPASVVPTEATSTPQARPPSAFARFMEAVQLRSSPWRAQRQATGTGGRSRRGAASPAIEVKYPPHFKMLAVVVWFCGLMWVCNYAGQVLPTIEDQIDSPCRYNDSQLTYNAKMLFVYFVWLAVARISLFVPCIANRIALVQSRTHGFCRTYCVHLVIRDGPLYIFVVGSMLFWFHLLQSPECEERSPVLYETLQLYAIYSCMISVLCLLLAYWHNKILIEATRQIHEQAAVQDRSAPPGTLEGLETKRYDPELFGDEEEKPYPSECAICLGVWEAEDVIKVTHCSHAFHEECIGNWLQSARTCALCRQDLTKPNLPGTAVAGAAVATPDAIVPVGAAVFVSPTAESATSPGSPSRRPEQQELSPQLVGSPMNV